MSKVTDCPFIDQLFIDENGRPFDLTVAAENGQDTTVNQLASELSPLFCFCFCGSYRNDMVQKIKVVNYNSRIVMVLVF